MRPNDPSDTATLIARSIVLSSRDKRLGVLVATGEAEAVVEFLGARAKRGWFGFAVRHAACRKILMAFERRLLRGVFAHYLARKRWIEEELRKSLEAGLRQVVVIGAGYDTLAWRLRETYPRVSFFEIDHPATQASKRPTLGWGNNPQLLAADLAGQLPSEVLAECREFDRTSPAFVIAEGLTMYFHAPDVEALLRSLAHIAGPEGKVLFSCMEVRDDASVGFRGEHPAVRWWLKLVAEPFRWGCARCDVTAFASKCGLSIESVADHEVLRREVLTPRGVGGISLARGEYLCQCSTSR